MTVCDEWLDPAVPWLLEQHFKAVWSIDHSIPTDSYIMCPPSWIPAVEAWYRGHVRYTGQVTERASAGLLHLTFRGFQHTVTIGGQLIFGKRGAFVTFLWYPTEKLDMHLREWAGLVLNDIRDGPRLPESGSQPTAFRQSDVSHRRGRPR